MSPTKGNPRIGVVGVADGWSTQRLLDAVATVTGERHPIELNQVTLDLAGGRVLHRDVDLFEYDALIVKKLGHRYSPELLDRLEVLHYLHDRGVHIFSKPTSMMRLLDRLSCTVTLRLADIPIPDTVITENVDQALDAVASFGTAILKPLFTSKARGMRVVTAGADCRTAIEEFRSAGNPVLYIQRRIQLPGRDLGIVFLGGQYLGAYARVAHGDAWNTTTHSGGKYQPCDPSSEVLDLAAKAQQPFDLDFTCVDVVETPNGPLVFEVSALGGFRGLLEACGIDAAARYTDYVLGELNRHD